MYIKDLPFICHFLSMGTRTVSENERAYCSGKMETNFSGYCLYEEIGALNQKKTTLRCYAPPVAIPGYATDKHWRFPGTCSGAGSTSSGGKQMEPVLCHSRRWLHL